MDARGLAWPDLPAERAGLCSEHLCMYTSGPQVVCTECPSVDAVVPRGDYFL